MKSLVAALLLAAVVLASPDMAQAQPARQRVVTQVGDAEPGKWRLPLNNARNVQQELGAQNVDIEIVAYGSGLGMLKLESEVGNGVSQAMTEGVKSSRARTRCATRSSSARTCRAASATSRPAPSRSWKNSAPAGRTCGRSGFSLIGK